MSTRPRRRGHAELPRRHRCGVRRPPPKNASRTHRQYSECRLLTHRVHYAAMATMPFAKIHQLIAELHADFRRDGRDSVITVKML